MADEPISANVPSSAQPAVAAPTPAPPAPSSLLDDYVLDEDDLGSASSVAVASEPVAAQANPAPPAPPSHPHYLIENALELGLSQQDIDRTPTDRLSEVVFHTHKAMLREMREQRRADVVQAAKDQPPPAPAQASTGVVPPEEAIDLGIPNEDDFAPELLGMLKRVVGGIRKELAEVKGQLAGYQQREFAREAETNADMADRVFARYKHALGDKGRRDLTADSPEYQRRMAVIRNVAADTSNLPLEAKLDKHAALLFGAGGSSPEPARATPVQPPAPSRKVRPQRPDGTFMSDAEIADLERWNSGATARPTARVGAPEPNGEAKAKQSVEDFFRERGEGEGEEDLDQFPQ